MTSGIKVVARSKKAHFNYELLERYEAGIVLLGSEVKSIRNGKVSINEAYARVRGGEVWLINSDISPYECSALNNHEPKRQRKLLLKKREIGKIIGKTKERGLTLVPVSLYFKDGFVKVEIALARGKRKYDKRESIQKREADRDLRRRMSKG